MARCPLKGARKSVMCPLRNIFIILGNERLTEVYQNERPDGAHNSIPVPFGAAQRPVQKFCHRSACASLMHEIHNPDAITDKIWKALKDYVYKWLLAKVLNTKTK